MSARKNDRRKQQQRRRSVEVDDIEEGDDVLDPPAMIIGNMAREVLALSAHMEGRNGGGVGSPYAPSYLSSPLAMTKRPLYERQVVVQRTPVRYNPGGSKRSAARKRVITEEIETSSESDTETSSDSDEDDDYEDEEADKFFKSLLLREHGDESSDSESDDGDGLDNLDKLEKIVRDYKKAKKSGNRKSATSKKSYDEVMKIAGLAVKEARNKIRELEEGGDDASSDSDSDNDDYF